jgi:hypothetical protein
MAYEQKDNEGILSRNEKMREGKKDSEFNGSAMVDGTEYWVNAWVNESKTQTNPDGTKKKYFKLQFKPKQQQSGGSSRQTQQSRDDDSDIPF